MSLQTWLTGLIRTSNKPRPVATNAFTCFVVRTGAYYNYGGQLTPEGENQAHQAATVVKGRIGSQPVVVLMPPESTKRNRPCYTQTSEIIAQDLKAPTGSGGTSSAMELLLDRRTMHIEHPASGILGRVRRLVGPRQLEYPAIVMILDGSAINGLLSWYPGPVVAGGDRFGDNYLGPPEGSVHQLVTTYNRRTGVITDRRFL